MRKKEFTKWVKPFDPKTLCDKHKWKPDPKYPKRFLKCTVCGVYKHIEERTQ